MLNPKKGKQKATTNQAHEIFRPQNHVIWRVASAISRLTLKLVQIVTPSKTRTDPFEFSSALHQQQLLLSARAVFFLWDRAR